MNNEIEFDYEPMDERDDRLQEISQCLKTMRQMMDGTRKFVKEDFMYWLTIASMNADENFGV